MTVVAPPQAAAYEGTAPVAYLIDLSSGAELYARNADRRIAPASMAKMMTVYVAFDMIQRGELSLDTKFTVKPETWKKWHGPSAGSTMFLSAGEQVSVADLLHGIVTVSGNDACIVLAEGIDGSEARFVERMNRTAQRIGLRSSQFGTSNGWPDAGRTYVTARDLAHLAERTIRDFPKLYKDFHGSPQFTWNKITQPNRNPILGKIAGADGIKTGHTEEAGYGFTGSAEQNGRRLIMVVAGLDSYEGRVTESVKFMDWGFKAWASAPVVGANKIVGSAKVQLGDSSDVALMTRTAVGVSVLAGTSPTYTTRIVYHGPLKAPIAKGETVAELIITPNGRPPQSTPLVAASDVAVGGYWDRARNGALRLFGG